MSNIEQLAWEMYRNEGEEEVGRRFFINYLNQIKNFGTKDLLKFYMKNFSAKYFNSLMMALPELWQNFTVEDWIELLENLGERPLEPKKGEVGDYGNFADIQFLCKFLEIDGLNLYLKYTESAIENKIAVINYMQGFSDEFIKDEMDFEDLSEGDDNMYDGFTYFDLKKAKQNLLKDPRIREFPQNPKQVKKYIEKVSSEFKEVRQTV